MVSFPDISHIVILFTLNITQVNQITMSSAMKGVSSFPSDNPSTHPSDLELRESKVPEISFQPTDNPSPLYSNPDVEKLKGLIQDEAGEVAIEAIIAGDLDQAKAKKVLKKIDRYILPLLCITYGRYCI